MTATPTFPEPAWSGRLVERLSRLLRRLHMTPEERFLRNATDLADLERRLRWLDRSAPIVLERPPLSTGGL